MLRATTLLLTCGLVAGLAQAGDVIVSRPPIAPNSENDGVMAGESDRFGDYRGVYPADSFELTATTTLGHMDVYGSNWTGGSTGFLYTGFTVTIFQDTGFGPDGYPYNPSLGAYGSTAFMQLPNVSVGNGLSYLADDNGVVNVRIDFTEAMGGSDVTLDPGMYWISAVPRMPDTPVGDPSGRWHWKMSFASPPAEPMWIDSDEGNWITVASMPSFQRPGNLGNSMAWELTGTETTPCPTDFDGSGATDFDDLLTLLSSWGPCTGCPADLDENGQVEFSDLLTLLSNFGPC